MVQEKTFEEFMSMSEEEQIRFDFSNINDVRDAIEHFFIYMTAAVAFRPKEKSELYKKIALFKDAHKKYGVITHPDGNSKLLQELYRRLWDGQHLNACWKDTKYLSGETMNSAIITLSALYRYMESDEEKEERKKISSGQRISKKYLISRYAEDATSQPGNSDEFREKLKSIKDLDRFLSFYHTLGNFLPFPKECNAPRGFNNHFINDYWDLTLACIYNWYAKKEESKTNTDLIKYGPGAGGDTVEYHIDMILNGKKDTLRQRFESWLESFGNWDRFVDKNFLGDYTNDGNTLQKNFVIRELEDGKAVKYGRPRELWEGHFKGETMPKEDKEFESFFANASLWIQNRGTTYDQKTGSCEDEYQNFGVPVTH